LVLFEENNWRRKPNLPLFRAENSVMVPLLVVATSGSVLGGGKGGDGGERVKRNALSMRMI